MVARNHNSSAIPPLVTIPVRRRVYYMAWSRLFQIPLFGRFIRLLHAFPVQIESSDPRAAREAIRLLQAGRGGVRFSRGRPGPYRRGPALQPGAFLPPASRATPVPPATPPRGHGA